MIESLDILLPPLPEQRAIASVLSSLDEKIDLLHRQNATLEALAETLFRQWFQPSQELRLAGSLNYDSDDSFDDHDLNNQKNHAHQKNQSSDDVGEDWEDVTLFEAIDLVGGGTPKTSIPEYWDGEINWLSGGDIAANHKDFVISTEKSITQKGLENSSAKLMPRFSTMISARGTVGKYCLLSDQMAFSQSNYGIKPKFDDCYFFTYLLIAHSVEELQSAAYGSVFDTITTKTFKEHTVLLPGEESIIEFENKVHPYFLKMLNNRVQIQTLEQQRDTLLPKLMSGEVKLE